MVIDGCLGHTEHTLKASELKISVGRRNNASKTSTLDMSRIQAAQVTS